MICWDEYGGGFKVASDYLHRGVATFTLQALKKSTLFEDVSPSLALTHPPPHEID